MTFIWRVLVEGTWERLEVKFDSDARVPLDR
jgi:hypothetical protein